MSEQATGDDPGIGVINATALVAALGNARSFGGGRDLAAWLGLVPRQATTGGKPQMLGICKRGNRYMRGNLIHGAGDLHSRKVGVADPLFRAAHARSFIRAPAEALPTSARFWRSDTTVANQDLMVRSDYRDRQTETSGPPTTLRPLWPCDGGAGKPPISGREKRIHARPFCPPRRKHLRGQAEAQSATVPPDRVRADGRWPSNASDAGLPPSSRLTSSDTVA
jgi:hypothetical protein